MGDMFLLNKAKSKVQKLTLTNESESLNSEWLLKFVVQLCFLFHLTEYTNMIVISNKNLSHQLQNVVQHSTAFRLPGHLCMAQAFVY